MGSNALFSCGVVLAIAVISGCAPHGEDPQDGMAVAQWKLRSISPGMTQDDVARRLGTPDKTRNGSSFADGPSEAEAICSNYNARDGFLFFEVCFRNGQVVFKAVRGYAII